MRFALFPFGSRGDVQPMVALGRTLKAQGHDVVVGTAPSFRSFVEDAGLSFHVTGPVSPSTSRAATSRRGCRLSARSFPTAPGSC